MDDRLNEEMVAYLEDEINAEDGLASLADIEGTIALGDYLESQIIPPSKE